MKTISLVVAGLLWYGCGNDKSNGSSGGDDDDTATVTGPTYHQDIAPLLSTHCWGCHTEGGMNSETLFHTPETAQMYAPLLASMVDSALMPPFYAAETDECPNDWGWKHDPRMTEEGEALLMEWAANGGPIGDSENPAPVEPPPSSHLAGVNSTVYPTGKFTTASSEVEADQFICLSIDPGLTEDAWLNAFEVLPDNSSVVHHVLTGIDYSGATADHVDDNGVYDCFGGFNPPGASLNAMFIGGWIPGAGPIEFPEESAFRMPAGSRIVLQMHYHTTVDPQDDGTGVALRFNENTPVRQAYVDLYGNADQQEPDGSGLQPGPNDAGEPTFFIPAGATDHTETMTYRMPASLPRNSQVFLIANHMHFVGRDMKSSIRHGTNAPEPGAESCLVQTPFWDFDWQQFYFYDTTEAAPEIWPGDELELQCTYDNVTSNPGVAHALADAGLSDPIDVGLGEGSLDEMCIVVMGQVFDVPLHVENETHTGRSEVTVNVYDQPVQCDGPVSMKMDVPGDVNVVTACGLDVADSLYTMEMTVTGTIDESGNASGTGLVSILGIPDTATFPWTSTAVDGTLEIPVSATGTFSGLNVGIDGILRASEAE
jgi:hypothetical protein